MLEELADRRRKVVLDRIGPQGVIVSVPLRKEFGVLYAEIDGEPIDNARRTLDVTGHYARPDLFSLHVHTGPLNPADFDRGFPGQMRHVVRDSGSGDAEGLLTSVEPALS